MTLTFLPLPSMAPVPLLATRQSGGQPADVSQAFAEAFGVAFSVLDATTGDLLHAAPDQPSRDWCIRAELARAVARAGRPEFIEASGPVVTLAVPIVTARSSDYVAVASLVVRASQETADVAATAELLGMAPSDAREWLSRQPCCPADALGRIAMLLADRYGLQRRLTQLSRETTILTEQMATTCEEINLLYCLTQHLRIANHDDQLSRLALEWLGNVVPAQGLALLWNDDLPSQTPGPLAAAPRTPYITRGQCALDREQFAALMERCECSDGSGPCLINPPETLSESWPYPLIDSLIAAPVTTADRRLGWLAAINRTDRPGFRAVDGNLFSCVATILGIHRENNDLFREQSELVAGVVHALTSAIDAKDSFTSGHSDRVARSAVRLGQALERPPDELKTLYLAGLLHDVGKIGIDDDVLRKPEALTCEEYEHIKQHPQIGFQILADLKKFQQVLPVVLHHHESWDGTGYPDALAGDAIPRLARIISVADAFDAMISRRPYRPGMPLEQIETILRDGAGKQWDPEIVAAFFAVEEELVAIVQGTPKPSRVETPGWT